MIPTLEYWVIGYPPCLNINKKVASNPFVYRVFSYGP